MARAGMVLAVETKEGLPMAMKIMAKSNPTEVRSIYLPCSPRLCIGTQQCDLWCTRVR